MERILGAGGAAWECCRGGSVSERLGHVPSVTGLCLRLCRVCTGFGCDE